MTGRDDAMDAIDGSIDAMSVDEDVDESVKVNRRPVLSNAVENRPKDDETTRDKRQTKEKQRQRRRCSVGLGRRRKGKRRKRQRWV